MVLVNAILTRELFSLSFSVQRNKQKKKKLSKMQFFSLSCVFLYLLRIESFFKMSKTVSNCNLFLLSNQMGKFSVYMNELSI